MARYTPTSAQWVSLPTPMAVRVAFDVDMLGACVFLALGHQAGVNQTLSWASVSTCPTAPPLFEPESNSFRQYPATFCLPKEAVPLTPSRQCQLSSQTILVVWKLRTGSILLASIDNTFSDGKPRKMRSSLVFSAGRWIVEPCGPLVIPFRSKYLVDCFDLPVFPFALFQLTILSVNYASDFLWTRFHRTGQFHFFHYRTSFKRLWFRQ